GSLTFDGGAATQINMNRGTYTFNVPIHGDDGLHIDGHVLGTVVLNSANTYSGLTLVTDGTLRISNSAALGVGGNASADGTRITGGDALELDGSAGDLVLTEHINLNGAAVLRNLSGDNVLQATIQANGSGNPGV